MKRDGRFRIGTPRVGCLFDWQGNPNAFADPDWAGDLQSMKSVSGGMILHEKHWIKAWMKQQSHLQRRSRTVRWQPCSHMVDGSSGVRQRPG